MFIVNHHPKFCKFSIIQQLYLLRFICPNCDEKFSTGRARNVHQVRCQNEQGHSSRGKRKRVNDPPGTISAGNGLFKIIEFCSSPDSPLVVETLHEESSRLADIIG